MHTGDGRGGGVVCFQINPKFLGEGVPAIPQKDLHDALLGGFHHRLLFCHL
jgi:hypothetical protein